MSGPTTVRELARRGRRARSRVRADEPLDELVEDRRRRAISARRGRALLAGVAERAVRRSRGRRRSRSASASTTIAFLPPISATTRFTWRCPARCTAARSTMCEADGLRAGEGDERHVGVLDERGADLLADAGQEREHPGRDARLRAGSRPGAYAMPGVCSAGLNSTALPVTSAAVDHAGRDREREVPRRDHRRRRRAAGSGTRSSRRAPAWTGRAGAEAQRLRGRSTRRSRSPRRRRRRPRRSACRPRTPRARRARRAAAHDRRGAEQDRRALLPRRRAPRAASARRATVDRLVASSAVARGRSGRRPSTGRRDRPTTISPRSRTGRPSIRTGASKPRSPAPLRRARVEPRAHGAGRRSSAMRLVRRTARARTRRSAAGARPAPAAGRRRPSTAAARSASSSAALGEAMAHERLVRGVLEQAADEVRHARHELADRRVHAHAQPERARARRAPARPCRRAAGARRGVVEAGARAARDRVGDAAQVVARERGPHRARVRRPGSARSARSWRRSRALRSNTGDRPALRLGRRSSRRPSRRPSRAGLSGARSADRRPLDERAAGRRRRPAGTPGRRSRAAAVGERGAERAEQLEGQVLRRRRARCRGGRWRPPRGARASDRVRGARTPRRAPSSAVSGREERRQRGRLHRDVDARERAPRVVLEVRLAPATRASPSPARRAAPARGRRSDRPRAR